GVRGAGVRPHDNPAILGFGGKRMFERESPQLFGQIMRVRAPERTEGASAATKLRHPRRSMPRRSCPLLLVQFLAGAPNVRATKRLMRSGAAFGELIADHPRNQILSRNETENSIIEVHRTGRLAVEGGDLDLHTLASAASPAAPPEIALDIRYLPGF